MKLERMPKCPKYAKKEAKQDSLRYQVLENDTQLKKMDFASILCKNQDSDLRNLLYK